jgi:hypothetical protein
VAEFTVFASFPQERVELLVEQSLGLGASDLMSLSPIVSVLGRAL